MEDWQLIQSYAQERSEGAFNLLVRRHIGLVHGTAFRLTNDKQLADDITQAVFILLARKAAALDRRVVLSGWLYRTTSFVAKHARRSDLRRQQREEEAGRMRELNQEDENWRRLSPLLDEALAKLKDRERDAVLLRYFDNKPMQEVGVALGVSEEAARKRIDRSVEKLRAFFVRQGISISAVSLATVLAKSTSASLAGEYAQNVANAAFAAGRIPAPALPRLAQEGPARGIRPAFAAALATILLLTASVTVYLAGGRLGREGSAQTRASSAATNELATNTGRNFNASHQASRAPAFAFRAVDAATGVGLANSRVFCWGFGGAHGLHLETNLVTDGLGRCSVPLVDGAKQYLSIGVLADGYEQRCVVLRGNTSPGFTLKVAPGTTIGGILEDQAGRPIAKASVSVVFGGLSDYADHEFVPERSGFVGANLAIVVTDAKGRWFFTSASRTNKNFFVSVTAPGFAPAIIRPDGDGVTMEQLCEGTVVTKMSEGINLSVQVVDQQHRPVRGAHVGLGFFESSMGLTVTDENGGCELKGQGEGKKYLLVKAAGFAPDRVPVTVMKDAAPVTIELQPARHLRLKVLDGGGRAIAGAHVMLQAWRGNNTMDWGTNANDQGEVEWNEAPVDEMQLCVSAGGYCYSRANIITADDQAHTIILQPAYTVSGRVVDAKSKQPIQSFEVIPGEKRLENVMGSNGMFEITINEEAPTADLQFEAEGHNATPVSLKATGSNLTCDVEMPRTGFGDRVSGIVMLPDHTLVAGADVALGLQGRFLTVTGRRFEQNHNNITQVSDASGEFAFPHYANPKIVVALSEAGMGLTRLDGTNLSVALVLQPWGRVEGRLNLINEPVNHRRTLIQRFAGNIDGVLSLDFSTESDASGHYVIDPAPAGLCVLFVAPVGGLGMFRYETPVEVKPGQTSTVNVGGGCVVTGRLRVTGNEQPADWFKQVTYIACFSGPKPPSPPANLKGDDLIQWYKQQENSSEATARDFATHQATVDVHPDGTFTMVNVVPGTYELTAQVSQRPVDQNDAVGFQQALQHPLGFGRKTFVVSDEQQAGSAMDIGTVALQRN